MDMNFETCIENAVNWAKGKVGSKDYAFKYLAFVMHMK